jgi:hypothetical protein
MLFHQAPSQYGGPWHHPGGVGFIVREHVIRWREN